MLIEHQKFQMRAQVKYSKIILFLKYSIITSSSRIFERAFDKTAITY